MQDASILPRHNPQIMDPKAYTLPLADLDKSGKGLVPHDTRTLHNIV